MQIENNFDALVSALRLAITAPSEEKSLECIKYADHFASMLSKEEVERAKAIVEADPDLPVLRT